MTIGCEIMNNQMHLPLLNPRHRLPSISTSMNFPGKPPGDAVAGKFEANLPSLQRDDHPFMYHVL